LYSFFLSRSSDIEKKKRKVDEHTLRLSIQNRSLRIGYYNEIVSLICLLEILFATSLGS